MEDYYARKFRTAIDSPHQDQQEPDLPPPSTRTITDNDLVPIGSLLVTYPDDFLNPFNTHEDAINFQPREHEQKTLRDFADHDAPFQISALIGPSGSGKTRLAVEWMVEYSETKGWHAAFLKNPVASIWKGWSPAKDTIIVIDYIFNYGAAIRAIIDCCESLPDGHPNVRLLVIDHIFPDKRDSLWTFSYWRDVFRDKDDFLKRAGQENGILHASMPILLEKSENRDDLLRNIIMGVGGIDDEGDPRLTTAMGVFDDDEKQEVRHPLFAALIGDAIKRGQTDYAAWSRFDIIDRYMSGKGRLPWEDNDDPAGLTAGMLVAAATVWGDADWAELKRTLPAERHIDGEVSRPRSHVRKIEEIATHIVSSPREANVLKAFRPDILGEFFVLRFLEKIEEDDDTRAAFVHMITEPDAGAPGRKANFAFLEFFQRLARNLGNYGRDRDRVEPLWNSLDAFLRPKNFDAVNAQAKGTVSIARMNVARVAVEKNRGDLRSQFVDRVDPEHLAAVTDGLLGLHAMVGLFSYREWFEFHTEKSEAAFDGLMVEAARRYDDASSSTTKSLIAAASMGFIQSLEALLENGFDPDVVDGERRSPLLMAAQEGHAAAVKALLNGEAAPDKIEEKTGTFPLLMAAQQGHTAAVKALLDGKAAPDKVNEKTGNFPLLMAAQEGHAAAVKALLDKKAAPDKVNKKTGAFPLLMAAQEDHADVVKALLDGKAAPDKVHEKTGAFPLLMAAKSGHATAVTALLDGKAAPDKVNEETGAFPLLLAAQQGHTAAVKALLDGKAAPDKVNEKTGNVPLLMAAQEGHAAAVKALLDKKAAPDKVHEKTGTFPLLLAAQEDHADVVKALLDKKAAPDKVHEETGTFPLLMAAQEGHAAAVTALLDKKATPNKVNEKTGTFPLILAAQNGHAAVVTALLDNKAAPDKINEKTGNFPLLLAAEEGHAAAVTALLDKKAAPDKVREEDETFSLLLAAKNGHASAVKALLRQDGIDLDKTGTALEATALMYAVVFDHGEIVKLLLNAEADPNVVSKNHGTALDIAVHEGHENIVKCLRKKGAKTQEELDSMNEE